MKKAVHTLKNIQLTVGTIFLTIFFITVVGQMITRYAKISATWTEEIAMYSFIWSVFLGGSAMVAERKHFAFTSLVDKLENPKHKGILNIVISLAMLFFAVLMVYYGVKTTQQFWNSNWINIPSFKRGPVWACIPVSGFLMCIYLIANIVEDFQVFLKGGNN